MDPTEKLLHQNDTRITVLENLLMKHWDAIQEIKQANQNFQSMFSMKLETLTSNINSLSLSMKDMALIYQSGIVKQKEEEKKTMVWKIGLAFGFIAQCVVGVFLILVRMGLSTGLQTISK